MKIKLFLLSLATAGLLVACGDKKEGDKGQTGDAKEAAAGEGQAVALDDKATYVEWIATKEVGGGHQGKFYIKKDESKVTVKDGKITAATLVFDLTKVEITDPQPLPKDKEEQLKGHLASPDFFNTEKFPTAKFELVSIEGEKVTGNLTLVGQTKSYSFNADVKVEGDKVSVVATTTIDRTNWGMTYNPKQAVIKNEVELNINLKSAN
ncbi:MAG: YceI family protein [Bacteroidetes bacterium]|nr:YceI family protein [Bacteroidota bacterium]